MRIWPSTTGGPKACLGIGAPCNVIQQRRAASIKTRITPTTNVAIKTESRYPVNTLPGTLVSGQKMFSMDSTPAVSVVTPTNSIGTAVIQAYFAFPMLIRKVVLTARAMVASNWFPVPKSGQSVEMEPVYIRYPQPSTTSVVVTRFPGSHFALAKG